MDKMKFGIRLQETRNNAEYTQEELAEVIEMSSDFVAKLERGLKNPSVDTLIKLSETLNVSADWLLGIKKRRSSISGLQSLDDEIRGLPVSTQKRLMSYMGYMIDYETQMENN